MITCRLHRSHWQAEARRRLEVEDLTRSLRAWALPCPSPAWAEPRSSHGPGRGQSTRKTRSASESESSDSRVPALASEPESRVTSSYPAGPQWLPSPARAILPVTVSLSNPSIFTIQNVKLSCINF